MITQDVKEIEKTFRTIREYVSEIGLKHDRVISNQLDSDNKIKEIKELVGLTRDEIDKLQQ